MIITRFNDKSEISLFKCVELARLLREKKQIESSCGRLITKSWITTAVKRLKKSLNVSDYTAFFGPASQKTLNEIAKTCNMKIVVWVKKSRRDKLRIAWGSKHSCFSDRVVNVFSEVFNPYRAADFTSMSLIIDIKAFTNRHKYSAAYNVDEMIKMTFLQSLVKEKSPNMIDTDFENEVQRLRTLWPSSKLHLKDIKKFFKTFKLGLQIWSVESISEKRVTKKLFDTYWKAKLIIAIPNFHPSSPINFDDKVLYIRDYSLLHFYECPKKQCFFGSNDRNKYERHIKYCRDETEITCKQVKYQKPCTKLEEQLFAEGILPSATFNNLFCAVYDLESFMLPAEICGRQFDVHRIVSAALKSNVPGDDEKFYLRENMDPESLREMVEKFVLGLEDIQTKMVLQLPGSISEGYTKYLNKVRSKDFKAMSPSDKSIINQKCAFLRKLLSLRVYGWNSERYDLPLLVGPMLEIFSRDKKKFQQLHTIKRGTGLMEMCFGNLIFRDFMNFSPPISLENFAISCGIKDISKSIFPYELYKNIYNIKNDINFPHYTKFKSALQKPFQMKFLEELSDIFGSKLATGEWLDLQCLELYYGMSSATDHVMVEGTKLIFSENASIFFKEFLHTSPAKYEISKMDFETKFNNMAEYLAEYNLLDVRLLLGAIGAYTAGFLDEHGINVHNFMSLPGVAQYMALKYYNSDAPPILSFGNRFKKYNDEIREQLYGGATMGNGWQIIFRIFRT